MLVGIKILSSATSLPTCLPEKCGLALLRCQARLMSTDRNNTLIVSKDVFELHDIHSSADEEFSSDDLDYEYNMAPEQEANIEYWGSRES